jgi:hypothetical protein
VALGKDIVGVVVPLRQARIIPSGTVSELQKIVRAAEGGERVIDAQLSVDVDANFRTFGLDTIPRQVLLPLKSCCCLCWDAPGPIESSCPDKG